MNPVLAISQAVIADAIRRKLIWSVVVFAALLAVMAPALPSYGQGVISSVYREVTISLMYAASLVIALGLASTRIPSEVERRTVFNVLSRDVRRWEYVVGTWLGMFALLGVVLVAFTVIAMGIGGFIYREWMLQMLQAALAVWLEMGVIMALTVLMSTRFGPITAVVAGMGFAFAGHSVGQLAAKALGVEQAPWWVPSLDAFNIINPVAHGTGYSLNYALSMVGVFLAWSALLLIGASAMFGSRDL